MSVFLPYGRQTIDEEDIQEVIKALKSEYLTTGDRVELFEQKLAAYTSSAFCSVVSSGTAALHLAALALLKEGDRVLTTPNTFAATSNALLYVGAVPVFVDICEDGNIDLDKCYEILRQDNNIAALFVVNFSGRTVDRGKLKRIKDDFDITILEDCSHSLGGQAEHEGNFYQSGSCSFADVCTFSFHPVKNITSAEGGAITTNSSSLDKRLKKLRNHGINRDPVDFKNKEEAENPWHHEIDELGFNYRLSDLHCALGLSQIKKLDTFVDRRQVLAERYCKAFENTAIKPLYDFDNTSAYHIFVVMVDFESLGKTRASIMNRLRNSDIGTQVHYIPIYKHPMYEKYNFKGSDFPNTEKYYSQCLSIPLYPSLTIEEQDKVISEILAAIS